MNCSSLSANCRFPGGFAFYFPAGNRKDCIFCVMCLGISHTNDFRSLVQALITGDDWVNFLSITHCLFASLPICPSLFPILSLLLSRYFAVFLSFHLLSFLPFISFPIFVLLFFTFFFVLFWSFPFLTCFLFPFPAPLFVPLTRPPSCDFVRVLFIPMDLYLLSFLYLRPFLFFNFLFSHSSPSNHLFLFALFLSIPSFLSFPFLFSSFPSFSVISSFLLSASQ